MRDDNNKYVNNKDFGYIAKSATSSRGSNTASQIGDQNAREMYNGEYRDLNNKMRGTSENKNFGKDMWGYEEGPIHMRKGGDKNPSTSELGARAQRKGERKGK